MVTVQQLVTIIQRHEPVDIIRCWELINEANFDILTTLHLVPDVTLNVTLAAGTGEYALADTVGTIWDAFYYTGANSYQALKPTNVDSLWHNQGPEWQVQPPSTPTHFYERGGMVGFFPKPSIATVGGFPKVVLYYTQVERLDNDSALPTTVNTVYPWVYHVLAKVAPITNPSKTAEYELLFQNEMRKLKRYIYRRVGRDRPRISANVPRVRPA